VLTIAVLGHGKFATGLVDASRMIFGEQEGLVAVELLPEDSPETFHSRLRAAVGDGDELLVLVDVKGGTPSNVAALLVRDTGCHCLAGANLPMLLEALGARMAGADAATVTQQALLAGGEGVMDYGAEVKKRF
jgi:mannose/fructose/sorbose-specific phosphotransferase system IIA component